MGRFKAIVLWPSPAPRDAGGRANFTVKSASEAG